MAFVAVVAFGACAALHLPIVVLSLPRCCVRSDLGMACGLVQFSVCRSDSPVPLLFVRGGVFHSGESPLEVFHGTISGFDRERPFFYRPVDVVQPFSPLSGFAWATFRFLHPSAHLGGEGLQLLCGHPV